jgi:hypothetical protein
MRKPFIVLLVIWIAYVALSLFAPPAASVTRSGLTLTETNLLRFTILLPLLFIWVTALYSVIRFNNYTKLLQGSTEAKAYKNITFGLLMLLLVILVPNFIGIIQTYYPGSFEVSRAVTITRNYATIAFYSAGFWFLWQASRNLSQSVASKTLIYKRKAFVVAITVALVSFYSWFVFRNAYRTISFDPQVIPTYFLPDNLIALTIIIPYALIWLMGGLTISNIWLYAKNVQGVIFREIFISLAYGLTLTVLLLIGLQFLSQANAALGHAAIKVVLVIIYLILLAIASGYLLIARSAKKLAFIEEVK